MKLNKLFLLLFSLSVFAFVSCGDDDECLSCTVEVFGVSADTEACDNGDGTITITSGGQSETDSLTLSEYEASINLLGGSCN